MSVRQQAPTVGHVQSKPRPPPCVFMCVWQCVSFLCTQIAGCIICGSLPIISALRSRFEQNESVTVFKNFVLFTYVLICLYAVLFEETKWHNQESLNDVCYFVKQFQSSKISLYNEKKKIQNLNEALVQNGRCIVFSYASSLSSQIRLIVFSLITDRWKEIVCQSHGLTFNMVSCQIRVTDSWRAIYNLCNKYRQ